MLEKITTFKLDRTFVDDIELFDWLKEKLTYIGKYVYQVFADDCDHRQDEGNQSFSIDGGIDDFDDFEKKCKQRLINFICAIAKMPQGWNVFLSIYLDDRTARIGIQNAEDSNVAYSYVKEFLHEM